LHVGVFSYLAIRYPTTASVLIDIISRASVTLQPKNIYYRNVKAREIGLYL